VFLRTLEYYTGTLFLTTNRPDEIDEAFQSRIHAQVTYAPLSFDSRLKIWNNFLNRCRREHCFSQDDVETLAALDMNGRQIKNTIKMAVLLASREKTALGRDHVEALMAVK